MKTAMCAEAAGKEALPKSEAEIISKKCIVAFAIRINKRKMLKRALSGR
jgi:hypothetical protein